MDTLAVAWARRSDGVIVSSTHLLPKTPFIQENMHIPTGKGPNGPQVKIPFLPTTHFLLRTVKSTALNNNLKNNFNLDEKYIL